MQKINLVPRYVADTRRTLLSIIPVVLLVAVVALGVMFIGCQKATLAKAKEKEQAEKEARAEEVRAIQARAEQERQRIAPVRNLAAFCRQFESINARYADVFEAVARYIWDEVTLTGPFEITGAPGMVDTVSFGCEVPNFEAALRFCKNIDRCAMPSPDAADGQPAVGGGTEPLWSEDQYSTASSLVPVFQGGWTVNGVSGQTALASLLTSVSGVQGVPDWRAVAPGVVSEGPVQLDLSARLANPITIEPVAAPAAPEAGAGMGGMGGMGMMGGMGGGAAPPAGGGEAE